MSSFRLGSPAQQLNSFNRALRPARASRALSKTSIAQPNLRSPLTHPGQTWGSFRTSASAGAEGVETPGRADLPKNFDPTTEAARYEWWEKAGYFQPSGDGEPFVIMMPPPNVTGKLHMGHGMGKTLQDIMMRYNRMLGKQALWLPGSDHAGIATQMVVERQLAEEGTSRLEIGREEFEKKTWAWKEQYGSAISEQIRRLGASCDWSRERFTLDDQLSVAVTAAFKRMHEDGLIYRGSYLVNWAPTLQTAVSDLEVEYSTEAGTLYYFKYPLVGGEEHLPVATTRPETILGDTAVAVHPEDPRFAHLVGCECLVPMTDRRIRVIADTYVDREFGTGALKITPGHDPNDYALGKVHDLDIINIMNKDATMNSNAGKYEGLSREACRKQLWADMEEAGLSLKSEPYQMRVPRSQRGGEVIEPLVSEQWFVRMEGLAAPALAAVREGDVKIVPARFEKTYYSWLDNIQDWCISRQLWWGHRIPVYYTFADEAAAEAAGGTGPDYLVAGSTQEALEAARQTLGPDAVVRQDPDVLDTWFSSGLWPFSTLGWPREADGEAGDDDLSRFFPSSVMETGHDILFFWVARMMMMGLYLTGESPFHTVFLHGLVRDSQGRKMSKSLGNVTDPIDTVTEVGADALRYTLATGTTAGQDLNLAPERMLASRNFTNKIWNAGKYILYNLKEADDTSFNALADADFSSADALEELPLVERWVVSELHRVIDRSTAAHDKYDFGEAGRVVHDFLWNEFADWYIEASKSRSYGDDDAAKQRTLRVLVYVFDKVLRLLHPFMPYVTEELWQALPHQGDALIVAAWPARGCAVDDTALRQFRSLKDVVVGVRNARAEYKVEPARKVAAQLRVSDEGLRAALSEEREVIALLARLDDAAFEVVDAGVAEAAGSDAIEVPVSGDLQVLLPLAGLFDADKEVARLTKQQEKIEKELAGLQGRLGNKKFVENAPEAVVAEVQGQADELKEQLAVVEEKKAAMEAQLVA